MVRRAVLIDGPNLYTTQKALGLEIDYKNLLSFLSHGVTMASAPYYFTAVRPEGEYASVRPLLDWLSYNGYHVVQKPVKEFTDSQGVRKIKGNMHVEIVVQAMTLAQSARIDELVLFSGDGDFAPLVKALRDFGIRVIVASSLETEPVRVADELRREAARFWELNKLPAEVFRRPSTPAA
jgi:uncharacterized LabA/DUF88 family protein